MSKAKRVLCVYAGSEGLEEHARLREFSRAAKAAGYELWFAGPREITSPAFGSAELGRTAVLFSPSLLKHRWLFPIGVSLLLPFWFLIQTIRARPQAIVSFLPNAALLAFPSAVISRAVFTLFMGRIPWLGGARLRRLGWLRSLLYIRDCIGILAVQHVVVPTEVIRSAVLREAPFIKQYITVLPNGLFANDRPLSPTEHAERKASTIENYSFPDRAFVLLAPSELHFREPMESLLHAISAADDERLCLLIWGDGREKVTLASITAGLGMSDRVVFLPLAQDLGEAVSGVDMLYLLQERGMSPALVHALGKHVPVLGSDLGSLPEVLGATPLLAKADDTQAMIESLELLLRSRDALKQARELAEAAAKKYTFNWGERAVQIATNSSF